MPDPDLLGRWVVDQEAGVTFRVAGFIGTIKQPEVFLGRGLYGQEVKTRGPVIALADHDNIALDAAVGWIQRETTQ